MDIALLLAIILAGALIAWFVISSANKTPLWQRAYFFIIDAGDQKTDDWIAKRLVKRYDVAPRKADDLIDLARNSDAEGFEHKFENKQL